MLKVEYDNTLWLTQNAKTKHIAGTKYEKAGKYIFNKTVTTEMSDAKIRYFA